MASARLHVARPFNWGLLLIADRGTSDIPDHIARAPEFAIATRSAIAVNVRHAQDTGADEDRAEVLVDVFLGRAPDGADQFLTELEIESGTIEIGDAEHSDEIKIGAGHWTVAIIATPADFPQHIQLWIERTAT